MVASVAQYYTASELASFFGEHFRPSTTGRRAFGRSEPRRRLAPSNEIDVIVDFGRGVELVRMRWGLRRDSPTTTSQTLRTKARLEELDGESRNSATWR
jgi:putative SOS response-associated peptidase YedK